MRISLKRDTGIVLTILLVLTSRTLLANVNEATISHTTATEPSGVLNVVTTISIITDWATQIGGELFTPVSVVTGSEDSHTYTLTPGEIIMIGESDLFIRFGLPGLEPWVQSILDAYPTLNVLSLASEDMMITDSVTGDKNEHLWMSPIIAKNFVSNITSAIISLDFDNRNDYETNRDNYLMDLDELIFDIEDYYFNLTNGLKVVIHHPSFFYLLDLLGVERIGVIEEHEGSEPSALHIQQIIEVMIEENVSIIVTQPQIEERLILQIARDTNSQLAKLSPLLRDNIGDNYITLIRDDIEALLNPEDIEDNQWIGISIAIGSSFLALTIILLVYLRFNKTGFSVRKGKNDQD